MRIPARNSFNTPIATTSLDRDATNLFSFIVIVTGDLHVYYDV